MPTAERYDVRTILTMIKENGSEANRIGMARYGINIDHAYGVKMDWLRDLGKTIGKDHELARSLWASKVHEAMILATLVADPKQLDRPLMESWVLDFYSWDLCDQCCSNLFVHYAQVRDVIPDWCVRKEEFVKRAGFVLIAQLAVKDKTCSADSFQTYLSMIVAGSADPRNNVKKAVNWALRQIGKRDLECHTLALPVAMRLAASDDRTARWIGNDAVKELRSEAVQERVRARSRKYGNKPE